MGQEVDATWNRLEKVIVPLFYGNRDRFLDVMHHAIALNGSFFNMQRMVLQYVLKAYFEEADWPRQHQRRTRGEYQENTKRIRREYEDNTLATRSQHARHTHAPRLRGV